VDSSQHLQNKSVGAKREAHSSRFGDESFTRSKQADRPSSSRHERADREPDTGMHTFRIEVGHVHGVKPGNIVGAIANEAGLDAKHIGRIEIYDDYSTLDLPDSMPDELLNQLKTVWVASRQLQISRFDDSRKAAPASAKEKERGKAHQPASTAKPAVGNQEDKPARKAKIDMQTFRIEVGHTHGVKPGNIVGAIANEAGLEAKYIGQIEIFDDYSVLDLPSGMPREIFEQLKAVVVSGQMLQISEMGKGTKANQGHASQKIPLSAPLKGGDRRVQEKQAGKKAKPDHSTSTAKRHSREAPSNSKPPRKNKKLA
jgi:ATP-dependent RNA helicase DeaD